MTQSRDEVIKAAEEFLASFDRAQRCPDMNKMLYDAKGLIRQFIALSPKAGEVVIPEKKLTRAGWQPCVFCGEWSDGQLQMRLHECDGRFKTAEEEKKGKPPWLKHLWHADDAKGNKWPERKTRVNK